MHSQPLPSIHAYVPLLALQMAILGALNSTWLSSSPLHPSQNYPILPHISQTPSSHLTLASTLNTFCHPKNGSSKLLQIAGTNLHPITGKTPQTHYMNNNL